ncbi:MAG: aminopeptidase P family protein [Clostridia bacterium]|nr:aminopeptidase P family protein [Clostridia bacterium]
MDRCTKLIDLMDKLQLEAVLVTDRKNVSYFSGFCGSAGYLFVTREARFLVTDFRYTQQAAAQAKDFEVRDSADFKLSDAIDTSVPTGFENKSVTYDEYCRFSEVFGDLKPLDNELVKLRSVKDKNEVSCIQAAAEIADKAFLHITDYMRPGITEAEVALELEMYMRKNGADGLSFDSIIASGANGAMPHAHPGSKRLENGEFVVMDYGCVVGGYCSDMTRTVAIGDVSRRHTDVYNDVLEVQQKCLEMAGKGVRCCDIHSYSSDVLNGKYPGCYGHGLGHGVGLYIHELPNLNSKSDYILTPGNIITVEPGVYINGFCGVRIEDLVLITDTGIQILSKSTKELIKIQ